MSLDAINCVQDAVMLHSFTLRQQLQTARQGSFSSFYCSVSCGCDGRLIPVICCHCRSFSNSHPSAFGALEGIWSEVTEWWYVGVGDLTRGLHILAHRIVTTSSSIILGAAKFRIYIYI